MYFRCMVILIISILSGCAFIDGLHNQGEPEPAQQNAQEAGSSKAASSANNAENRADTNAAKALAPLTH